MLETTEHLRAPHAEACPASFASRRRLWRTLNVKIGSVLIRRVSIESARPIERGPSNSCDVLDQSVARSRFSTSARIRQFAVGRNSNDAPSGRAVALAANLVEAGTRVPAR